MYLDDFLLVPGTLALQAREAVRFLFFLGFQVNLEKSQLQPVRELGFLGLVWNPSRDRMWLPDDKVQRISEFLQKLLTSRLWSWEDSHRLLGFLGFAAIVVPFGRIHCRLT